MCYVRPSDFVIFCWKFGVYLVSIIKPFRLYYYYINHQNAVFVPSCVKMFVLKMVVIRARFQFGSQQEY